MNKALVLILTLVLILNPVFALEKFDLSVDEEIRKNYQVDDASLPPLPKIYSDGSEGTVINKVEIEKTVPVKELANKENSIVIKSGTKLKLKSLNGISDSSKIGNRVSFISVAPVTTMYKTIPANTVFYGKVLDAHAPQIAGNGGLLVIGLDSVKIDGKVYSLSGNVTKANKKHIFFNNIKGKRRYVVNIPKTIKWGRNVKNKMYKLTGKYSKKKITWILCPFTFVIGTFAYGGNIITAPLIALKYKGNRIVLDKDTIFEFKLTDNLYIY